MNRIAIIGTGITGLSIGYHLKKINPNIFITFFEKARRVGGRITTRTTRSHKNYLFDHGVPFLTKEDVG
jgi:protoporphyrinogen oxidase